MGRPPLGKIAMTSTERSCRHRLKHRPEQPATKPCDDAALATARERIAELEAQVANLAAENAALKARDRERTTAPTTRAAVGVA